ncbi:uncharacterized protein [Halyomorpha halys]|uniref:uncharacterized protein n=1 Tax=Halyomorpha halys TaxID=286706 RepID=UPI0006D4D49B|nr:uncharacterized protein LOC106690131 [Halyomorpha halys]XP_014290940.1 uncharacterized protein LOC106690131 [Halyomorpha halys]XP_014290941.1 uncharacterized protein LOC106690131 [Halyomorpha halys]
MAKNHDSILESMIDQMAQLTVTEKGNTIQPLENYFPPSFKIHDYNPTENKIIKTSILDDDIKNWLRNPANNKFVFQCLLCCQEMTFHTVFLRGDYVLNRSHLLTPKHMRKVKDVSCVGVLLVSSQKFIMCLDSIFEKRLIFNVMKTVKRREELQINDQIRNLIFCYNYSIYTFDMASKSLCEMDIKCDIVDFMIEYIRPLFNFHCLLCDIKSGSFTQVVKHLGGRKHIQKVKGSKGVIISIRDFNLFVACNLDELSSFIFLDHLNSYLEEIVIASTGTIIISGCHSKEGKQSPKDGEIRVNVKAIPLPNGDIAEKSIKVTTRYNNFLTDTSENEFSNDKLATRESRINRQGNVTIYEYSNQDFEEHCMDNIIHALFTIGCRIWCSRCRKGIFTLQALQTHLSSVEHTKNMRNNEQIGFMCHVCKIFFIELKGESLVHTHSSYQNKQIIKKLSEGGMKSLGFNTPLNNSITEVYRDFLDNIGEACKFCCLACNDFTKQELMYLGYHEISTRHKSLEQTFICTYCEWCNVIYIDTKFDNICRQFELHFAKHLNDNKGPITFKMYGILDNNRTCYSSIVDKNFFFFQNISLQEKNELFKGQKLTVSFSQNFTQFENPGVCFSEFGKSAQWDNIDLFRYLQLYTDLTGKRIEFFECCNLKNATKAEIFNHLFVSGHQLNQLYKKEIFIKICDICNLTILTGNIRDLQEHFNNTCHIKKLSTVIGLPFTAPLTFDRKSLSLFMNMSRSSLSELIKKITSEMKENYQNRQTIFNHLTKDILALMSDKFPDLTVTFYGSRLSGLATRESDFDVFLNLGNDYLYEVKDLLGIQNNLFKLIVCISDCAVPVIQAEHKATGYICEFNMNNPGQHVNTSKIIKILTDLDERVLWLLAAVKHWSIATKIRGTHMFSSHAITWLVLFYLMQPDLRIIPNISFVIKQCGDLDNYCDEDHKLQWQPKINKDKTWLELLEGFFNYYSLMKFSEYKLFPSTGLAVPRIQGIQEDDRPIFMQDPLYKERNILFNATKEKAEKFMAACYYSLHLPWRLND